MAALELAYTLATPSDAPQIQSLIVTAFRAEDTRPNWTAYSVLNEGFTIPLEAILARITPDPPGSSAVIKITNPTTDDLVATFILAKSSTRLARLGHLSIDQKYQRQGLGRRILRWAEEWCVREWQVEVLDLNALNTREELIGWYERCGFVRTGVVEEFPYQYYEGREGVPEGLGFVVLEKRVGKGKEGGETGKEGE